MSLLFGEDVAVARWVSERVGVAPPEQCVAIGVVLRDRLVGGVVYFDYRGCDLTVNVAAEDSRWLSRGTLRALFGFPFVQLGCLRISALIDKRNRRARDLIQRVGFRLEGTHPRALAGRDACSYGMLREHCRWITNGEQRPARARAAA